MGVPFSDCSEIANVKESDKINAFTSISIPAFLEYKEIQKIDTRKKLKKSTHTHAHTHTHIHTYTHTHTHTHTHTRVA
jgi:hypothetical protein